MDGLRRRNESIAKDHSTMDERKEFFRQLGLPRFEVYDYAVRSFKTPSFDLDYFEYRRYNLQKQNLSQDVIKKHLLNEVRNTLQEHPKRSNSFQSQNNRKVATPPPPSISDFLPPSINVEKNKPFKNNQNFQQNNSFSGYGNNEKQFDNNNINQIWFKDNMKNSFNNQQQFGNNNDQFVSGFGQKSNNFDNQLGYNMNSQIMSSNQGFQQSSANNDRFNNNNYQNFQQFCSGFGSNNDLFSNNMNQGFQQSGSSFGNNDQFDNNMNSSKMSNNQGFGFNNFFANNQNSQGALNIWQEKTINSGFQTNTTQQFGPSNWNQNSMQSNITNWGQNTPQNDIWIQGSNQLNQKQNNSLHSLSFSRDQNPPMRSLQSNRDYNPPARGAPTNSSQNTSARRSLTKRDRNPPARGGPANRNQNPPARGALTNKSQNPQTRRNRLGKDRNPIKRVSQSNNVRNVHPAKQPKPKSPTTTKPGRSSKPNRRQNSTSMSNFQANNLPNNFNNNLGNCNDANFFPNNSMNTGFNNFPIIEPNLEDQVSGIMVQALQHISNTINQPMNKSSKGLRLRMKAKSSRKNTLQPIENPFLKQRTKSFEKQFKKFDCCILLSRRSKTDSEDLVKGLSFLKNIKKRPMPIVEDDSTTPATKRLKQNNEKDKEELKTEQETSKTKEKEAEQEEPKNEQNSQTEKIKTADSKPENEIQKDEQNAEHKLTFKRKNCNTNSLSQKKVETFTKSIMPDDRIEEFIKPEVYGDDLTKMPKRYDFKDYGIWYKQYRWVKDHIMKVDDTDPALKKIFFCSTHVPRKINNDKIIECEKIIANALKIQEERFMHKEAYAFLKARTQYTEFLYVFKKSILSHDGLRCLQQIYDHLLTANIFGFYKGIIEKFALTYGENGCESKKPKNKELLADKAFNWLVGIAFKELKRMFIRSKLNERLTDLYTLGCFIDKRTIENAKNLYKNYDYAHMEVKNLEKLIEKQPEINWKNCREFMRLELLVSNDLYNKFLEGEIIEKRKNLLEKLKTDPYVEKVHIYMARKLLYIYERIKYLESIHPRMISRQDLKQLIAFRRFLAVEDLKLMVKHIMDQWKIKYGKFTNPEYKKLFPSYPLFKNNKKTNGNETDENAEELDDNEDDDGDDDDDETNANKKEITENKEDCNEAHVIEDGGGDDEVHIIEGGNDEAHTIEDEDGDAEAHVIEDEEVGNEAHVIEDEEVGNEAHVIEDEEGSNEAHIIEDEDGDEAQINENGDKDKGAKNIQKDITDTIDLITDDEKDNNGGVDDQQSVKIDSKQNEIAESTPKRATRARK